MGLLFFPRGGSSHVARNLARGAAGARLASRHDPLAARSRIPGRPGDARDFYAGSTSTGRLHRARSHAPTRCSPTRRCTRPTRTGRARRTASSRSLDDDALRAPGRAPGRARSRRRRRAGGRPAPAPPHAAQRGGARASRPDVPVVGHLHGTELLMLEAIEADPARWPHARRLGGADARLGGGAASASSSCRSPRCRAPSALLGVDARALRAGPQRLRPADLHAAATSTARRTGAATWSTSRTAGRRARSRVASATRTPTSRRSRPTATRCCSTSAASPRSSALPLLIEAYARARPASRAARRSCSSAASRASGRASTRSRRSRRTGARGRLPRRLARPRRAARLPRRLRRRRAAVRARAVRPGARGGHGLRAAGDRGRRAAARPRSSTTATPAGSCQPGRRATRSPNALVEAVNRPAERRRRGARGPRVPASATPGRRCAARVAARSTHAARQGAARRR